MESNDDGIGEDSGRALVGTAAFQRHSDGDGLAAMAEGLAGSCAVVVCVDDSSERLGEIHRHDHVSGFARQMSCRK